MNRLIAEFTEALPHFATGLPVMEEQYHSTLPVRDARCFQSAYKMKKEMFQDNGTWIYETPELICMRYEETFGSTTMYNF